MSGTETIEEYGHKGVGVVSRKLISQVVQNDKPFDGGWGYDSEAAASAATVDGAISSAIEETAQKVVSQGVSYAGEVPTLPDGPEPDFKPFPTLP
jgi:hypothetical protein